MAKGSVKRQKEYQKSCADKMRAGLHNNDKGDWTDRPAGHAGAMPSFMRDGSRRRNEPKPLFEHTKRGRAALARKQAADAAKRAAAHKAKVA